MNLNQQPSPRLRTSPPSTANVRRATPITEILSFHAPDFYPAAVKRVLRHCGHECGNVNFSAAVETVNKDLNLKLGRNLENVFGVLLTQLSFAQRFRGNPFITPPKGENSAVHSLHSAVLTTEVIRRTGLLTLEERDPQFKRVVGFRRLAALGALVHDLGEILGETNSLSSASLAGIDKDDVPTEQRVFQAALKLAFHAVSSKGTAVAHLHRFIAELQIEAGVSSANGKVTERVLGAVKKLELQASRVESSLPSPAQRIISKLVQLYETVEMPHAASSESEKFLGYFVKAAEHVQGSRHLVRLSRKMAGAQSPGFFSPHSSPFVQVYTPGQQLFFLDDMALPLELAHSLEITSSVKYTEGEIGKLFKYASNKKEESLACSMRDTVYLSLAERFHLYGERYVDRTHFGLKRTTESTKWIKSCGEELESEEVELLSKIQALSRLSESEIWSRNDQFADAEKALHIHASKLRDRAALQSINWEQDETRLYPVDSLRRLRNLYLAAVQQDYRPAPGEILFTLTTIPENLRSFTTWREFSATLPVSAHHETTPGNGRTVTESAIQDTSKLEHLFREML